MRARACVCGGVGGGGGAVVAVLTAGLLCLPSRWMLVDVKASLCYTCAELGCGTTVQYTDGSDSTLQLCQLQPTFQQCIR